MEFVHLIHAALLEENCSQGSYTMVCYEFSECKQVSQNSCKESKIFFIDFVLSQRVKFLLYHDLFNSLISCTCNLKLNVLLKDGCRSILYKVKRIISLVLSTGRISIHELLWKRFTKAFHLQRFFCRCAAFNCFILSLITDRGRNLTLSHVKGLPVNFSNWCGGRQALDRIKTKLKILWFCCL